MPQEFVIPGFKEFLAHAEKAIVVNWRRDGFLAGPIHKALTEYMARQESTNA